MIAVIGTHRFARAWRRRAKALRFRFLRRVHRRGKRSWWSLERTAVSRGVAVGLFFGILTPVAQIAFAVPTAIVLRGNVLVAALSTLLSNPFTLPFVYLLAFRIGSRLSSTGDNIDDIAASELAAEKTLTIAQWPAALAEWASGIALPFFCGLVLLASAGSLIGYVVVQAAWSIAGAVRRS